MKQINFVDAQEMHKNNPETFYAPDNEKLENLKKGDIVKVSTGGERFWCIIDEIKQGSITATIDNNLVGTDEHGLKYGDSITFESKHIFNIYD